MSEKNRIFLTLPAKLLDLIDTFVNDGFYMNRGDLILDAIRYYLRYIRHDKTFINEILATETEHPGDSINETP